MSEPLTREQFHEAVAYIIKNRSSTEEKANIRKLIDRMRPNDPVLAEKFDRAYDAVDAVDEYLQNRVEVRADRG